jgi:transposase
MREKLKAYFLQPKQVKQRQYEALRTYTLEEIPARKAADIYGFSYNTFRSLLRDFAGGELELFAALKKGPTSRRTLNPVQLQIIQLRKSNLSSYDIREELLKENIDISLRTIQRILSEAGFTKLPRRTYKEIGLSSVKSIIPERSSKLDFAGLSPFRAEKSGSRCFFLFALYYGERDSRYSKRVSPP